MSVLDLQTLETPRESWGGGHGGEGGSELSLLLCDSALSVTLCL
ncbi:SapB/AmfS family lanthipeptide [Actinospica sp.]|jgi:hypothetical protein|nr:SapB/AmfS family lanthipeptide [Actinospica sp.]HWG26263.1 SapB/AmfS family lanthipeptide [Actinospica sp.]